MSVVHLGDLLLGRGDALLVVNVQNDFLPGGSIPVPRGDEILEPVSRAIDRFAGRGLVVVGTRDWHPADHCSFRERGGPWPAHCVRGSWGAEFPTGLPLPFAATIVSTGTDRDRDSRSGFDGTDLKERLRGSGVKHVFVAGLTTEHWIAQTVRDALDRDFTVSLLLDAVRPLEARPGDGARALDELLSIGALPMEVGPHEPHEHAAP